MKRMTKTVRGRATRGVESRFRLHQQVKGRERKREEEKSGYCE